VRRATDAILGELTAAIRAELGDELLGLYLYGSYVSGGFDDGISDVDLVAVTAREADELDFDRLDRMHTALVARHPEWTNRLDIVYIGRQTLAEFRTSRGKLAVISPGEDFQLKDGVADWAANWYRARETGITLFGPPGDALIPEITWAEFTDALRRYVEWFKSKTASAHGPGYRAYSVLSCCRALYAVRNGSPASKQQAAEWARQELPDWAWLIDAALECRRSGGRVGFDDPRSIDGTNAFVDLVSELISEGRRPDARD
jgi:predicted nucleotidyltransferase